MSSERGTRALRVGERLREELATLLADGEVKDPGVIGAVVTRVEMSNDLRGVRVYVRLLSGEPRQQRELVAALRRASGMLRRELTHRLSLRYAPELRFFYDEGIDHTTRVEELLEEIKRSG